MLENFLMLPKTEPPIFSALLWFSSMEKSIFLVSKQPLHPDGQSKILILFGFFGIHALFLDQF
jgi:hypothetical protein